MTTTVGVASTDTSQVHNLQVSGVSIWNKPGVLHGKSMIEAIVAKCNLSFRICVDQSGTRALPGVSHQGQRSLIRSKGWTMLYLDM